MGVDTTVTKKRLDSWKSIAEFMNRSLRTVQRWHECNGLPVHHFGGHKGSVFAFEDEIDHWLAGVAEVSGTAQAGVDEALKSGKRSSSELSMTADGMWETRSERSIQTIANLYRKAIDADSRNSAAFTGLANALVFCALNGIVDGTMAYPSAMEALRRIPQLDSEYLDAKCPAAWIDMLYNHNWRQARAGFAEIVNKRPSSFAIAGQAAMHIADGRIHEALACGWQAWRLNPLVCPLGGLLCWILYLSGDVQQVLNLVAQIRTGGGDESLVAAVESLVLIQDGRVAANMGRLEEAASEFPQCQTLQGIVGYAYGILGEMSRAEEKRALLAHCTEAGRKNNGYALAIVSLGLDNRQEAISWLEAAYAEGALWSLGFRFDPILRPLKGNPRFARLLSRIGATTHSLVDAGFPARTTEPLLERAVLGENPRECQPADLG